MEPNWQPNQQPRQGGGRPTAWSGEGEYAQRPLGSSQEPRYQQPYHGQGSYAPPAGQAWQGYPQQPSAAPTPSNP